MKARSWIRGPSPEAQAFMADPANRDDRSFDVARLPAERAELLAAAEAAAPGLAAQHGVSLRWTSVSGRACLEVAPKTLTSGTTLLYLFGGGFVLGSPLEDLQIFAPIAAQAGMRVVAPSYRLAPEHPWPAAPEDAFAVAAELAAAGDYQICGESAGGNLALCAVQSLAEAGIPQPSALALLSPAADMSDGFDPHTAPDDPLLSTHLIEGVAPVYAGGRDTADPAISPLFGRFGPDWPDTIITTGTRDRLLGPCVRLERTIRSTGGYADLRVWDGLCHVFEYYPEIPEAALSLSEIAGFLSDRDRAKR